MRGPNGLRVEMLPKPPPAGGRVVQGRDMTTTEHAAPVDTLGRLISAGLHHLVVTSIDQFPVAAMSKTSTPFAVGNLLSMSISPV